MAILRHSLGGLLSVLPMASMLSVTEGGESRGDAATMDEPIQWCGISVGDDLSIDHDVA